MRGLEPSASATRFTGSLTGTHRRVQLRRGSEAQAVPATLSSQPDDRLRRRTSLRAVTIAWAG